MAHTVEELESELRELIRENKEIIHTARAVMFREMNARAIEAETKAALDKRDLGLSVQFHVAVKLLGCILSSEPFTQGPGPYVVDAAYNLAGKLLEKEAGHAQREPRQDQA